MEDKIKLLNISKRNYRNKFGFPKEQIFFQILRKFLVKLGFDEEDINISGYGRPWEESNEEPILDKEDNIQKYINRVDNFSNIGYSIDIIYFDDEINLIINSKENKQKIISEAIEEFIMED